MFGLLNVDKPPSVTSRDVVNRVQRAVRPVKVGHAGTLDPLATGVLVICLGPATRLAGYVQRMRKCYRAEFLLGCSSETEDTEGHVVQLCGVPLITAAEIHEVLHQFTGTIDQRPPAYSAVKVSGRRAYQLARQGTPVDLPARTIVVHRLQLVSFDYPRFSLDIECGSGTYVRSLGRDIAVAAGSSAVMSVLVRTRIGPFRIEDAITGNELSRHEVERNLLNPQMAVNDLPRVTLSDEHTAQILHGQVVLLDYDFPDPRDEQEVAVINQKGSLIAIGKMIGQRKLKPYLNLLG